MNIVNDIGILFLCILFYATGFMSGRVKLPKRKELAQHPCPHGHLDWDECPVCSH
jgi:hypothetical protein